MTVDARAATFRSRSASQPGLFARLVARLRLWGWLIGEGAAAGGSSQAGADLSVGNDGGVRRDEDLAAVELGASLGQVRVSLAMGHDRLGPTFVNRLLEPMLQAVETRLAFHRERGELRDGDLRHLALALVSPLLLAVLHQGELGGRGCRPLDLDAFAVDHLAAFLRAHAA